LESQQAISAGWRKPAEFTRSTVARRHAQFPLPNTRGFRKILAKQQNFRCDVSGWSSGGKANRMRVEQIEQNDNSQPVRRLFFGYAKKLLCH